MVEVWGEEVLFYLGSHCCKSTYMYVYYGFVIVCCKMRLMVSDIFGNYIATVPVALGAQGQGWSVVEYSNGLFSVGLSCPRLSRSGFVYSSLVLLPAA